MDTKKTLTALALGAAILGAGYHTFIGLKRNSDEVKLIKEQPKYASSTAVPGALAPDFSATSIDGKSIKLSDLENKIVLLDFWAPWCVPCRELTPSVVELYEKQKQAGLEVIYIAAPSTKLEDAVDYVKKNNLPFPIIHDKLKEIGINYGIEALPSLVVIKNGVIQTSKLGYGDCFKLIEELKKGLNKK